MWRIHSKRVSAVLVTIATVWLSLIYISSWSQPKQWYEDNKDAIIDLLYRLQDEVEQEGCSQRIVDTVDRLVQTFKKEKYSGPTYLHKNSEEDYRNDDFNSNTTGILPVCSEKWLGPKADYPYYIRSWRIENCSNSLPLENVLTVLLYIHLSDHEMCVQTALKVLDSIRELYPTLHIVFSSLSDSCVDSVNRSNVTSLRVQGGKQPGFIWNSMCKLVKTPYAFIARDLDSFLWTVNLEREVRMVSSDEKIGVAGGAIRNQTGHWKVGCFQMSMKNYILEYTEGYYTSKNSCMFCDYLAGPFVVRTSLLLDIPFNILLPDVLLFEDWFLQVKRKIYNVVNCPDVMYTATDAFALKKMHDRELWVPLARAWHLNRIVTFNGNVFSFTCKEADISCKGISTQRTTSLTQSLLMPICCIEQTYHAIKVLDDFCNLHNLSYELDSGSVLGAIKVNGMIPWDIDADYSYYTANYSVFKDNAEYFKQRGVKAIFMSERYFELRTPDVLVQLYGMPELSHDTTLGKPFQFLPTLVLFGGCWIPAPHNPGSYVRGFYGPEILKHSHSWLHIGLKNAYEPYKPGRFNKCKDPGYHACAEKFSADGNLQFRVPNPLCNCSALTLTP